MATIVLKAFLETPDLNVEARRLMVERSSIENKGIYELVHGKIGNAFPVLEDKLFALLWKDDDNDFVTMSSDEEIRDLMSNDTNGVCKIYVKINDRDDKSSTVNNKNDADKQSLPASDKKKANHQREDPWTAGPSNPEHPGCFPAPYFPFHAPGPFAGPGWRGRGGNFSGFPGHQRWHPWHGHGYGQHLHHGYGRHGDCKKGWKESLRNVVSMPQRRWAKLFIQSWRKENLTNATTTTSDSDGNCDWKSTMEEAGINQSYVEWLRWKLLRWHKKWSSDEMEELDYEAEKSKMEKNVKKMLKESVPPEFRLWTKWYLNTHFGKRTAPQFKKDKNGCKENIWTKGNKKDFFRTLLPKEYRKLTRQFIRDWRIEMKLDEKSSAFRSEDCSDDEANMEVSTMASLPEAYKQWLEMFLLRWHTWRGQLERNPEWVMRGGMHQFKDTVPNEFRQWVKNYLRMTYDVNDRHRKRPSDSDLQEAKYNKMLQAFQKKWLENQQVLDDDSDNLFLLPSSDEDENTIDKGEPEIHMQKLTIMDDGNCKKSKVTFADSKKGNKKQKMEDLVYFDTDDNDEDTVMERKHPMNYNFRQWAKQNLAQWDGKTFIDSRRDPGSDVDEDIHLSPNTYHWMSKMMMKMQMKKMKQQFKAAKREMKRAKTGK